MKNVKKGLADRLIEIEDIPGNNTASYDPLHYELPVTVWLLKDAAWQGARRDIWSFRDKNIAIECRAIVSKMIKAQKRKGNNVWIGKNETDYWNKRLHTLNFTLFYEVEDVIEVSKVVVKS